VPMMLLGLASNALLSIVPGSGPVQLLPDQTFARHASKSTALTQRIHLQRVRSSVANSDSRNQVHLVRCKGLELLAGIAYADIENGGVICKPRYEASVLIRHCPTFVLHFLGPFASLDINIFIDHKWVSEFKVQLVQN